jgi:hypothetical protein
VRRLIALSACVAAAGLPGAASAAEPGAVSLSWAGDIAFSRSKGLPSKPASIFSDVRPLLGGVDVTTGNLEGTLGRGGPNKCASLRSNCFAFQAPASYARVFRKAGFDLVNLANNHSHDFGDSGLRQTVAALKSNRIAHTGLRGQVRYVDVGPTRVAFLGFAPYGWTGSLLDIPKARGQVSAAALRADRRVVAATRRASRDVAAAAEHADVVVVFIHAGGEGPGAQHVPHGTEHAFGENRGRTRAFAHSVIAAGADAVLGSGPHVLRGIECYRRRPVAYSLGDFAAWHTLSTAGAQGLSGVLRIRLDAHGRLLTGRLRAVHLTRQGLPRRDPKRRSIGVVRRLSRADFGKRACRIDGRGNLRLPE